MRVALDASYSVDPQPSGISVYSNNLLTGLALAHPGDRFLHCYRPKQLWRSPAPAHANVTRTLLQPFVRAEMFHALNQRVDWRIAKRVVTTFHDLFVFSGDYSSKEFKERFTHQARDAAAQSDLIITVSEFTARQVTDFLGVRPEQIRVVPHGVRPAPVLKVPREQIVLFVGALQVRKNISRLVSAFRVLPEPWRLVLAGSSGGFGAGEILNVIERSRARARIELPGYVSQAELDKLFACASIFAFPSLDEGFGIPVLEAMSRGVPVLTSNGSALAEVAGGAALLVNPYDTDEIAAGLQQLAFDTDMRQRLIRAGYRRASQFTWEGAVERTYRTYCELSD